MVLGEKGREGRGKEDVDETRGPGVVGSPLTDTMYRSEAGARLRVKDAQD